MRTEKFALLVQRGGAYTYVDHPIYYLGMMINWGVAILTASDTCLLMPLTAHVSALGFLYGTEIPDIRFIYQSGNDTRREV